MHVSVIDEQLGRIGGGHQRSSRIEVALIGEAGVVIHPMYLQRDVVGPFVPELPQWDAGIEEQCAGGAGPGLSEHLSRHHPHGEPGVDQVGTQLLALGDPLVEDGAEPDRPSVRHPLLQSWEGLAFEEIGGVHRMTGGTQLISKCFDSRSQALNVVEQEYLGHGVTLLQ